MFVTMELAGIPVPLTGIPTARLTVDGIFVIDGVPVVVSPVELTLVSVVVPAMATVPPPEMVRAFSGEPLTLAGMIRSTF